MLLLPQQIFSTAEIKYIEREYAKTHNGHCYDLMEKAGQSVAGEIRRRRPGARTIWVFAGRGNNGGDGYIAAAALRQAGLECRLFSPGRPHEGTEAMTAFEFYKSSGGTVEYALPQVEQGLPDVIVDALLGTGISSAPRAPLDEWIVFINRCHCYTVAVDVPSGVAADTGTVPGDCVCASLTVCMLALKPGLITGDAVDYTGDIVFQSLGLDISSYFGRLSSLEGASKLPMLQRSYEDIASDLPVRVRSCNKSDNGKVLIIAGSKGMGGAAVLCGMGALRAGAGLVKVATDSCNLPALNSVCPELMSVPLDDEDAVRLAAQWADVIAIGSGLGRNSRTSRLVDLVLESGRTCVFDADALNVMADSGAGRCDQRIVTPHPGEAARLLKISPDEVNADRFEAAFELQQSLGGVVLLKGAGTVVCDGHRLTVILEGSPAMATGGSGDLLTGIIVALAGQGLTPHQAAVFGACVHGRAGTLAGLEGGVIGTLPSDLCPYIRRLLNGGSNGSSGLQTAQ